MMASGIEAAKKHVDTEAEAKLPREILEDRNSDVELDFSSDIKEILHALSAVKQKASCDRLKKNEEIIDSFTVEVKSMIEEAKLNSDKERQSLMRTMTKACKDAEGALKHQYAKFHGIHEKYLQEKKSHLQATEDAFSKFEEQKEKLLGRLEHLRKKDKVTFADVQTSCLKKLAEVEEKVKKRKREEKSIHILRKSLGSFLEDSEEPIDLQTAA